MTTPATPTVRTIALAALAIFAYTGFACGLTAMNALFISLAGARSLAYVYLLTPALMAVTVVFFTWVLNRWHAKGQLQIALAMNVAAGLVLWSLYRAPSQDAPLVQHIAGLLMVNMWLYSLYSAFWNFADSLFSTREARRSYPYLAASLCGGYIIGGELCTGLSAFVPTHQLFLIWSGAAFACLPATHVIARLFPVHVQPPDIAESGSFAQRITRLAAGFKKSPFARALAAQFFLVIVLALLCEYLYLSTFELHAQTTAAANADQYLTGLLGRLTSVANLLNLGLTILLMPRLVQWFGVRNVVFIVPTAYLLLFVFVSIQMSVPLAIAAFFVYQSLHMAIDQNNQNLLVRALPSDVGPQLRTIIEGASEPCAVALVGLFLLPEMSSLLPWAGANNLQASDIGLAGLGVAAAALGIVALVRTTFYPALRANVGTSLGADTDSDNSGSAVAAPIRVCLEVERSLDRPSGSTESLLRTVAPASLDKECMSRLLSFAPLLDSTCLDTLARIVRGAGLDTVPALVRAVREEAFGYQARTIAAAALSLRAPRVYEDLFAEIEPELLDSAEQSVALEQRAQDTAASCLWIRWLRQQSAESADLLIDMAALTGRIADAHAVRRLLRSRSRFDRSEGLDAIEQGFSRSRVRRLQDVLEHIHVPMVTHWERNDVTGIDTTEVISRADTYEPEGAVAVFDMLRQLDETAVQKIAGRFLAGNAAAPVKRIVLAMAYGAPGLADPSVSMRRALADPHCSSLDLRNLYLVSQTNLDNESILAQARHHACLARSLFYQWAQ